MNTFSATYCREDDKLRLYATSQVDPETYAHIQEAGFKWKSKQRLFVASNWTPAREDLLLDLAGDIREEDQSMAGHTDDRVTLLNEHSARGHLHRLKRLMTDLRATECAREQALEAVRAWSQPGMSHTNALLLARCVSVTLPRKAGDPEDMRTGPTAYGVLACEYSELFVPRSLEEIIEAAKGAYMRATAIYTRWIAHYTRRIAFERTILGK